MDVNCLSYMFTEGYILIIVFAIFIISLLVIIVTIGMNSGL